MIGLFILWDICCSFRLRLCPFHTNTKVAQTSVSFKSLSSDSAESGLSFPAPADFDVSLESSVEELVELGCSGFVSGPWSDSCFRNRGTTSCSFVKRPRWSSTLQPWALVSMSRNPWNTKYITQILIFLSNSIYINALSALLSCHTIHFPVFTGLGLRLGPVCLQRWSGLNPTCLGPECIPSLSMYRTPQPPPTWISS